MHFISDYLFLFLSLFLSFYLSFYLYLSLSLSLSISISISISLTLSLFTWCVIKSKPKKQFEVRKRKRKIIPSNCQLGFNKNSSPSKWRVNSGKKVRHFLWQKMSKVMQICEVDQFKANFFRHFFKAGVSNTRPAKKTFFLISSILNPILRLKRVIFSVKIFLWPLLTYSISCGTCISLMVLTF